MAMVVCRVLSVVLLLGLYSTSSVTGNNNTASDTVNTLYTSYHEQLHNNYNYYHNTYYDHLMLKILCDPFSHNVHNNNYYNIIRYCSCIRPLSLSK